MRTREEHWNRVYEKNALEDLGWYQKTPHTSLKHIESLELNKNDEIIDIGGGDSFLIPELIDQGFTKLSVVDISKNAIERAKARLEGLANNVSWIASNIIDFSTKQQYQCWHDRAAFHFLISEEDQDKYVEIAANSVKPQGYLVIGTFASDGPEKCSGLPVQRYSVESLNKKFENYFSLKGSETTIHTTPSGKEQSFIFCIFQTKL